MTEDTYNGWTILHHPAFSEGFDALIAEVRALKATAPDTWATHPKAKLLKRVREIVFTEIPRDPDAPEFRQGNTLGTTNRHWRRAKFFDRFRLFFRFDSASKLIVIAWVNDGSSLRKQGSKTDPYTVFRARLSRGDPPGDWAALKSASKPAAGLVT